MNDKPRGVIVVDDRRNRDILFATELRKIIAKTPEAVVPVQAPPSHFAFPDDIIDLVCGCPELGLDVISVPNHEYETRSKRGLPLTLADLESLTVRAEDIARTSQRCGKTALIGEQLAHIIRGGIEQYTLEGYAENLYGTKCWRYNVGVDGQCRKKLKLPRKLKKEMKKTIAWLNSF